MKMSNFPIRRSVLLFILCAMWAGSAFPKARAKPNEVRLVTIKSNPAGAVVHLNGDYQFIGRTPFVIPYPIFGPYELKVKKLGYESIRTRITFSDDTGNIVNIRLKPRTRYKAMYRSMLFPGWGQRYSERKTVGTIFFGATTASLIYLAKKEKEYRSRQTDYELALRSYQQGGLSFDEQQQAFGRVENALRQLEDARDSRDITLYVVGGIWLLNVLESVFFFPDHAREIQIYQNVSMGLSPQADGIRIGVRYSHK